MPQCGKNHATCARKRRYWSEIEARIVADIRSNRIKRKLYAYKCPTCQGWHLTKMVPAIADKTGLSLVEDK